MKKSLALGAAALLAVAAIPSANAAGIEFGGYYKFQAADADAVTNDQNVTGADDKSGYWQRLGLNIKAQLSEKSAFHAVTRPLGGNQNIEGGASFDDTGLATPNGTVTPGWQFNQIWAETEAWGVGVKAGQMPIKLNDNILVNDDGDEAFGGLVLSKTFDGITAVAAHVKVDENVENVDQDDIDLIVMALLGKMNNIDWNLTVAHAAAGADSNFGAVGANAGSNLNSNPGGANDVKNTWVAMTLGGKLGGVSYTWTGIWEDGYEGVSTQGADYGASVLSGTTIIPEAGDPRRHQLRKAGYMTALRLKGTAGALGWNAYGCYGTENFNSISNRPHWSLNYASNFVDGGDLMHLALGPNNGTTVTGGTVLANDSGVNTHGAGVAIKTKAGAWTVKAGADWVRLTETNFTHQQIETKANIDSAMGGFLQASTSLDKGVSLVLTGQYVSPDDNDNGNDSDSTNVYQADSMHVLSASLKLAF